MSSETKNTLPTNTDTADSKPLSAPSFTTSEERILQREFAALTTCLKDAVIKTGQIYSFYADTRKLKIEKHVANPPRSLTTALGRDIEMYDQLCDSIEAHLLRAIGVLKRDLRREEEKIEAETRRKNAEALMLPPALPPISTELTIDTNIPSSDGSSTNPRNSPALSTISSRRPSAISISSLHRPQFPLKLDLSATSLRITEEEAALYSKGLASPVTLAPKSARPMGPNEFPAELMAAFAASSSVPMDSSHGPQDIDLPLPTNLLGLGVGLGDSSDKPIELDLDAMDIEMANMTGAFGNTTDAGESSNANDGLFSPMPLGDGEGERVEQDNINLASSQQPTDNAPSNFNLDPAPTDELFGDLTPSANMGDDLDSPSTSMLQPQSSSVPSPGSLLAQFSEASGLMNTKVASSDNPSINDTDAGFDINSLDLSNLSSEFFSNPGGSEMQFMDMHDFLESQNLSMDSIGVGEKANADDNND